MKKLTLILAAMVLTASQAFGQCGKCGYEVKAENAYTNYNVRYASNPMDAKHYTTDRLRGEFAIEKVFAPGEAVSFRCLQSFFLPACRFLVENHVLSGLKACKIHL